MTEDGPVHAAGRGARIDIRVIPRSPRAGPDGVRAGRLLLRVTAPPVEDAANQAVLAAMAELLGIPKRAVRLVSGGASRNKVVEVDLPAATVTSRLLGACR